MRRRLLLCGIFCALIPAAFAQAYPNASAIRVHEIVMRTLRDKQVDPAYPADAVKAGNRGLVELRIRISKTGDVLNVQLVNGDPALAPSAIEAIKQWHYKPYLLNGVPIQVDSKVTLRYEISSGEGIVRDALIHTPAAK
jgi:TonB family protein